MDTTRHFSLDYNSWINNLLFFQIGRAECEELTAKQSKLEMKAMVTLLSECRRLLGSPAAVNEVLIDGKISEGFGGEMCRRCYFFSEHYQKLHEDNRVELQCSLYTLVNDCISKSLS